MTGNKIQGADLCVERIRAGRYLWGDRRQEYLIP